MNSIDARSTDAPSLRSLPAAALAMAFRSVGVLAVLAVPVVTGLGSVDQGGPGDRPQQSQSSEWKASYSERYPGCVPSVLWPDDEKPVAVLTKTVGGRVDRIVLDDQQRPLVGLPAGARTIGACR